MSQVVIIDGQGGKLGRMLVEAIRSAELPCELIAVGTNSIATAAMLKAGADIGATGENPVLLACRSADILIGPLGILAADSMFGEITPAMAQAVGQSKATKLLLPINLCRNQVVGLPQLSYATLVAAAVEELRLLLS